MEDEKILELDWNRDEDAIAQTARAYGAGLQSLAEHILRCVEDAQECVSDTYLRAWNAIPPQRPAHLRGYLSKICRNQAFGKLDWQNAAKRGGQMVALTEELAACLPDRAQDQDLELEGKELGRMLTNFLGAQSQESRRIFIRRYWYCDSIQEIAQRYGLRESTVKTRLFRTREKLRTYLQKEGIYV